MHRRYQKGDLWGRKYLSCLAKIVVQETGSCVCILDSRSHSTFEDNRNGRRADREWLGDQWYRPFVPDIQDMWVVRRDLEWVAEMV
jgi:hypothetical protein